MRMRVLPFLAAAVLGVACALLVACGDRNGLIPSTDAASLDRALRDVAAATASGACGQAEDALAQARDVQQGLPDSVDSRLRARLQRGIENLEQRVPESCAGAGETQPPPESTQSVPTETVPSVPTETVPSVPSVPTETVPSVPTETTPSVPTETTPPPDGTGGVGADQGPGA